MMDILPISVCYAAMLVKVVQCWNDKDLEKSQHLVNHTTVNLGKKWRSSNISDANLYLNRSKKIKNKDLPNKVKLVNISNSSMLISPEDPHGKKVNDPNNNDLLTNKSNAQRKFQPLLQRINTTLTRSKDAVWATISLTFICIVLLLAVAHSRMWKDYHGSEAHHGIPRPNFNERVPFKDVLEHKMALLKEFVKRKKDAKRSPIVELESLLHDSDDEN